MLSRAHVALLASVALLLLAGPVVGHPLPDGAGSLQPAMESDVSVPSQATADTASSQQSSLGATETALRIGLEPNGDAVWTIRRNYSLGTPERREAFESVAEDFGRAGETSTIQSIRYVSEAAAESTGREMAITGIDRRSAVDGDTGTLITEFTWTNFARKTEGFLYLDDVFRATSGTWFGELDENQTLTVVPPAGYDLYSASPTGYEVSNASLQWEGRQTFDAGEPSIAYQGSAATTPTDTTSGALLGGPIVWLGLLVALILAAVVAYLVATRDFEVPSPASPTDDGDDGDEPPAAATTTASTPDGGTAAETEAAEDDGIDEELLSDEERIERLLEQNGGRMKQANIVKETDWSNAKVSQLLSAMDDDDRIDKLRIGRENLISFPDEDIADTNGEEP